MKSIGTPRQYACFKCRKSFKRPRFGASHDRFMTAAQQTGQLKEAAMFEAQREYKCPDCGGPSHFMGQDFKAPKHVDVKAWEAVQAFIEAGKTYYRNRGG